jgi:Fe-S-cluster-containing dehydrogenase component
MQEMAIFQDVDKCMRCNGCVLACKREWDMALPSTNVGGDDAAGLANVKPQSSRVKSNQRLAIKSQRRGDMGGFVRYTCWHCPSPPCAGSCPLGAIVKQDNGAVSVDTAKCDPGVCKIGSDMRPCEIACQRGGYPKVGVVYESAPSVKMNKCTLCHGRAGSDVGLTALGFEPKVALPTRATSAEIAAVPEKAHEPACVSSCPAKAMRWDTKAAIRAYCEAEYGPGGYGGNGSIYWGSRKMQVAPPKADPFIEDHIAPMASSLLTTGRLLVPTLVIGGLAAISARRARNETEATTTEGV